MNVFKLAKPVISYHKPVSSQEEPKAKRVGEREQDARLGIEGGKQIDVNIPTLYISTDLQVFRITDSLIASHTPNPIIINSRPFYRATIPLMGWLWGKMRGAKRAHEAGGLPRDKWIEMCLRWRKVSGLACKYVKGYRETCEGEDDGGTKRLAEIGRGHVLPRMRTRELGLEIVMSGEEV